jgi:MFS family permease
MRVGLIRGFVAAAATLTITIVTIDLSDGVGLWAFLRFMMGASMAAVLAISDAWINDTTPNEQRGAVIAVYSIVLGLASLASQMVFLFLSAGEDFVLVFAITMNLSVVLVALTSAAAPDVKQESRKTLRALTSVSTTANVAAFTSGFMTASVISIVPFYLTDHGVPGKLVAMVLATLYLGRLLFQWPIGRISDRLSRRSVVAGLSFGIALSMTVALVIGEGEGRVLTGGAGMPMQTLAFLITLLLGGMLFPLYSVASALAFDRAEGRSMIDISTTLLAVYSIGSIAGPLVVMLLSEAVADASLLVCVIVASGATILVSVIRKFTAEEPEQQTPVFAIEPQSSVEMLQAAA